VEDSKSYSIKESENMKFYSDDYHTVVAKNQEEAIKFFIDQELTDEEGIEKIREINPYKKKMCFPLDQLPEEYHDEDKHPRKNWLGEYIGVEINLQEALKYSREKPPFVISISSELM